jgi:hypothetical protein
VEEIMGGVCRGFLVSFAVCVLAVGASMAQTPARRAAGGGDKPKAVITVRVYDYAHLDPKTLRDAEAEAGQIFRQGGIQTNWMDCPPGRGSAPYLHVCKWEVDSGDLILNILPQSMARRLKSRDDILGSAYVARDGVAGSVASVFFDRIKEASERANVASYRVLADVMAHEAGHLILGANSHTERGVMRGEWEMQDLESLGWHDLKFSAPQVEELRLKAVDRLAWAAYSSRGAR